jgi:hypothetical protein
MGTCIRSDREGRTPRCEARTSYAHSQWRLAGLAEAPATLSPEDRLGPDRAKMIELVPYVRNPFAGLNVC